MLLTCDIGNSKIKSGFFKGNKLSSIKVFEDTGSLLKFISGKKITSAAVSSVVPGKLRIFKKEFNSRFNFKPAIIDRNSKFNLKIDYKTPETLGIDRLCSAEGAFYLYNINDRYNKNIFIISVDFGTATTINIVRYNKIFTGGLILPGVNMMFKSLKNETAQLPVVKPSEYKGTIGNSTKSSIASGVISATTGAIKQTIDHIKQKNNKAVIKIF
ncbi:MAG: type III pantothenate kinase, partial [Ignavibacteriaceae bacterium]